jgi:hypothetical protein
LNGLSFPVSQIFKTALMAILLIRLSFFSSKLFLSLFGLLSFAFLQIFLVIIVIAPSYDGPFAIFTSFLKFYLFVLSFLYIKSLLDQSDKYIKDIYSISTFNFLIIISNVMLGILGFGFPVYSTVDSEVSVGVKGYFFAGNELSAVFIILASLTLAVIIPKIKKKYIIYGIVFILFIFSVAMATKTAIGGMLILSISTIVFHKKYIEKEPFNIKNIIIVAVSSFLILSGSIYFFVRTEAFERMQTIYYNFANVYKFMMSGRDQYLSTKFAQFASENSVFKFVFGVGEPFPVEMDPFDTFFRFGIVGLLVVYTIYFSFNIHVFKYYLKEKGSFEPALINLGLLLIFVQSFISGHVLFSGMAGPFYGIALAISFSKYRNITKQK